MQRPRLPYLMPLPMPMLVAICGVAFFSVMDALMKRAASGADVYSALLLRSLFGLILMLPVWWLSGNHLPDRARLRIHALRAMVSAGMAWLFFWGLVRLPMAEAIALSFFAPLITIYLAAFHLGEKVRPSALAATLAGLAGVGVIAANRLGQSAMGSEATWGIAAVLGSAVLYAWNLVLQRQQAQVARPQEVALFQNLFVCLILLPAWPWAGSVPAPMTMIDIALSAGLTAIALMLLSWAYARAEAQALVASEYTAFGWAALMGWAMFDEPLAASTVAGVVLITGACWLAARRADSPAAPLP